MALPDTSSLFSPSSSLRDAGTLLRRHLAEADDDGYFGPESAIWQVHTEAVLAIGIGRALLLQLAHPWVAQAVADHSTFREQSLERLVHTIGAAGLLVFGSRAQADWTAAHIRHVHTRINGVLREDVGRWQRSTRYTAEDPDALLWVLVTLMDTTLLAYESVFGPLAEKRVEEYLEQATQVGTLVGVRRQDAPRTRRELANYMDAMIGDGTVAVSGAAREMAAALERPNLPLRHRLVISPYQQAARGFAGITMPEPLLAQYAPVLRLRGRPLYHVAGWFGRRCVRRLPESIRWDPLAQTARARGRRPLG